MSKMRVLAGLIGVTLCGLGVSAQAQSTTQYLPPSSYYLPANFSDALFVGDVKTRALLASDSLAEPNPANNMGVERPLTFTIPVTLSPGILAQLVKANAPLFVGDTFLADPGVPNTDPNYLSDILVATIALTPGVGPELTVDMFSDSDVIAGVPIGLYGGLPRNMMGLFETGRLQDVTSLLDVDGQCPDGKGMGGTVACFGNPATGNELVVYGVSDLDPKVPEPSTWAMMLTGFGWIGLLLSRTRRPALA